MNTNQMYSTKRKFNALLNGMGNKSTSSLISIPSSDITSADLTAEETEAQAKKRRIATPKTTTLSTSSQGPDMTTVSLIHKKSARSTSKSAATEPLAYSPWDRTEFLKRLKSFSNVTDWTSKPTRVNEVEWAKRGWVCQTKERVRCCYCHVEILVKLNRKEVDGREELVLIAQNIEDALVDRYVELIITSHDEDCLWRARGCDDKIFKLPLSQASTAVQALQTRYGEICSRDQHLPYLFNIHTPPGINLDLVLSYLPSSFFQGSVSTSKPTDAQLGKEVNKVALEMALFGWEGHIHDRLGNQPKSVSCHACFRVLGLWLFKSKKVDESGKEVESAVVNGLDVIAQHREYCPWRSATSQNGTKSSSGTSNSRLTGWETLILVLKNEYLLKTGGEKPQSRPVSAFVTSEPSGFEASLDDASNNDARDIKDKERWARLKRVKSMFESKGNKLHRPGRTGKEK